MRPTGLDLPSSQRCNKFSGSSNIPLQAHVCRSVPRVVQSPKWIAEELKSPTTDVSEVHLLGVDDLEISNSAKPTCTPSP